MAKVHNPRRVFSLDKAHEHYPELHVVVRDEHDCSLFLRTPNGQYYHLRACKAGYSLTSALEGFSDLITWFYSSAEEFEAIHGSMPDAYPL